MQIQAGQELIDLLRTARSLATLRPRPTMSSEFVRARQTELETFLVKTGNLMGRQSLEGTIDRQIKRKTDFLIACAKKRCYEDGVSEADADGRARVRAALDVQYCAGEFYHFGMLFRCL